jgi:hypothetical protein
MKTREQDGHIIECDVPIPEPNRNHVGRKTTYPWTLLEVGESFFVELQRDEISRVKSLQEIASKAANRYRRKFTTRTIVDDDGNLLGVRFWREPDDLVRASARRRNRSNSAPKRKT